eukprot:scaffold2598_cov136-Cylindrotheca_fusiformis.AAC.5
MVVSPAKKPQAQFNRRDRILGKGGKHFQILLLAGLSRWGGRVFIPTSTCTYVAQTTNNSYCGLVLVIISFSFTMQHPEVEDDVPWIYSGQEEVSETVRRVKIADTVTKIPDHAFHSHPELEEVVFSSSVQVIGESAFHGCEKLKCILYQGLEKEEVLGIPSNVKRIDFRAFAYCTSLARLVLNEGLEEIGVCAFTYCESLTEVEFPSTVKHISIHAFNACTSLVRLGLNEGLETIRLGAFSCCSLSHIRIPRSITCIRNAFSGCSRLISIELPELPEERSFEINLTGCQRLVSLAGPLISTYFEEVEDREEFFLCSKLGSLYDWTKL